MSAEPRLRDTVSSDARTYRGVGGRTRPLDAFDFKRENDTRFVWYLDVLGVARPAESAPFQSQLFPTLEAAVRHVLPDFAFHGRSLPEAARLLVALGWVRGCSITRDQVDWADQGSRPWRVRLREWTERLEWLRRLLDLEPARTEGGGYVYVGSGDRIQAIRAFDFERENTGGTAWWLVAPGVAAPAEPAPHDPATCAPSLDAAVRRLLPDHADYDLSLEEAARLLLRLQMVVGSSVPAPEDPRLDDPRL